MIRIRQAAPGDADAIVALQQRMDAETSCLLYEAGERPVEAQRAYLAKALTEGGLLLLAEDHGVPVGMAAAERGRLRRKRHTASFFISILQSHWGMGIGKRLMQQLESSAAASGIRRLEAGVRADNTRALALYASLGFVVEGVKRQSLHIDGHLVDETLIARLLP